MQSFSCRSHKVGCFWPTWSCILCSVSFLSTPVGTWYAQIEHSHYNHMDQSLPTHYWWVLGRCGTHWGKFAYGSNLSFFTLDSRDVILPAFDFSLVIFILNVDICHRSSKMEIFKYYFLFMQAYIKSGSQTYLHEFAFFFKGFCSE